MRLYAGRLRAPPHTYTNSNCFGATGVSGGEALLVRVFAIFAPSQTGNFQFLDAIIRLIQPGLT